MQTIFGKKETSETSTGDVVLQIDDDESAERESNSLESCFPDQKLTSGNLQTFSLRFDNPDFSERDSYIFSLSSNKNSTISTSRSASGTFRHRRCSLDLSERDTGSFSEVRNCKSKSHLSPKSEKQSKSHDSLSRPSDNLLLKKTEEISDFNFKKFNEINMIKDNSFQCTVERLVLAKEKRARSDLSPRDTEMSLSSEIDVKESQTGDCKRINKNLLSRALFKRRWGVKKRPDESRGKIKDEGFLSKKSFFNKTRFMNFFVEKNENTSNRNMLKELSMTEKGDANPKILRERFVNSKVPPEEDLETKQYFKDLFFYIIYLVLLTTIAQSMVSSSMYYFSSITASLFLDSVNSASNRSEDSLSEPWENGSKYSHEKTLREAHTFDDFWNFAETTMIDLFYWNFYYFQMNAPAHTKKDDKKMFYENQILGVPRLRQVRVRGDSCSVHPDVQRFFNSCYYFYSPFTEETKPIKKGMETSSTATAWIYTKAENLNTSYYWGEISVYGGGGYYLDLDVSKEKTREMIKELRENVWISSGTRAIFIDFNIYNANVNLFCLCKLVLEFPPVGGIIPNADFNALKLIRYITAFDFFILGCEFLLMVFLFYFIRKLLHEGLQQKYAFFLSFWNCLDLIIILLLGAYIILSIIRYISTHKLIRMLNDRLNEYTEFNFVKNIQINFNNVIAVLLFASWIKFFKYLLFNLIMLELRKTLQRSLKGILGFLPMFLTIYLGFAFLANLLFGSEVKDFNTVRFSFLSLLQAFVGHFQYSHIQESHPILGPIFYVAFIFFIFLLLLNVFIAITNDAYAKVKSEVLLVRPRVGEYAKAGLINLMTCCRERKKLKKKTYLKKKLIFCEIRKALMNAGFHENEIKIFFSKYNIKISNILDENTRRKVMEDLELKRVDFEGDARQNQINFLRRKMNNLSSRLDDLELNLQPVIDKVDVLLDRFSSKK